MKWYETEGRYGDIVFSSRIRLARNLENFPFPASSDAKIRTEVCKLVVRAVLGANANAERDFIVIDMAGISRDDAVSLVERRIISPEFLSGEQGKVAIVSKDEDISVMINEEDHVRIQVMNSGLSLENACAASVKMHDLIFRNVLPATDDQLGYLTQCLTNLGTGMRASTMLHLPALSEAGAIGRISSSLSKLGLAVRGSYGEGTKASGSLYQVSNQITLGIDEKETIQNLESIVMQIVNEERGLREQMKSNVIYLDKIGRAVGVLKTAIILTIDEFMNLFSLLRLGVSMGLVKGIEFKDINRLTVASQPATLGGDRKTADVLRAKKVRELCKNIEIEVI